VIEATLDVRAQLVRIKHIFQMATTFAARADPASRVVATILMDYVAESALKTVYWAHPATAPTAKEAIKFPELLNAVADLTGAPPALPLRLEIGNLHTQRNFTQHRNLTPSAEDVSKNGAYLEAFLRHLFTQFFAVDFDGLTLASLVLHRELRAQLEEAETHLVAGRRREAVEEAAKALHKTTWMTGDLAGVERQEAWIRFNPYNPRRPRDLSPEQQEVINEIVEWTRDLWEQLAETLRALAVGGDWAAYMRFRAIAPHISFGDVAHRVDDYSEDDARAVFHYALDQILRLEAMGALPAPREEE
jgi:hypothetical protein